MLVGIKEELTERLHHPVDIVTYRDDMNVFLKICSPFHVIHQASDFTDSPAGVEKLDFICMMLIVVGESLKLTGRTY